MLVTPTGEERIGEIVRFMHEAVPISKAEFDGLVAALRAKPTGGRELLFLKQGGDLATAASKNSFAREVGDHVVQILNERRAAKGLPPLRKTKAGP